MQGIQDIRTNICAVPTCEFNGGSTMVRMFKFPKDFEENRLWREAIKIKKNGYFHGKICINHFDVKDVIGLKRQKLKKGAIPMKQHTENLENQMETVTDITDDVDFPTSNPSNENVYDCDTLNSELNSLKSKYMQLQLNHASQIKKIKYLRRKSKLLMQRCAYEKSTRKKTRIQLQKLMKNNSIEFDKVQLRFFTFHLLLNLLNISI